MPQQVVCLRHSGPVDVLVSALKEELRLTHDSGHSMGQANGASLLLILKTKREPDYRFILVIYITCASIHQLIVVQALLYFLHKDPFGAWSISAVRLRR